MHRSSLITPDRRSPGSHAGLRRLGMTTEEELRFFAFGSAVFLLFGILADRTSAMTGNAHSFSSWSDAGISNLAAFGLTIVASGIYLVTRLRGEIFLYACACPWKPDRWDGVHPAVGPFFATAAALIGAAATFALIVMWLRDERGK